MPVKGQGRWVQFLISEFEKVYRISGDANFNLIIVDFNSTDIDVKMTLQDATLPRYQLVFQVSSPNFSVNYWHVS